MPCIKQEFLEGKKIVQNEKIVQNVEIESFGLIFSLK